MPLVRISLTVGKPPAYRRAIADGVHVAFIKAIPGFLTDDRFQIVTEHAQEDLIFSPSFLNIPHTPQVVFIQIFLGPGRKPADKRALFKEIVDQLQKSPGVPPNDVIINLVETAWENWSFGQGIAQYLDPQTT